MGFGEMFMAALQGVALVGVVLLVVGMAAAAGFVLFWTPVLVVALVIRLREKINRRHEGSRKA